MDHGKAEGVVLGDQASMDAWMEEFNQRPRAERDQVLGPSAYPPEPMGKRPPFLPVTLPTDDELEQALTRAPFLYQLIGLVDYIGKGKALTQTGNLKLASSRPAAVPTWVASTSSSRWRLTPSC